MLGKQSFDVFSHRLKVVGDGLLCNLVKTAGCKKGLTIERGQSSQAEQLRGENKAIFFRNMRAGKKIKHFYS